MTGLNEETCMGAGTVGAPEPSLSEHGRYGAGGGEWGLSVPALPARVQILTLSTLPFPNWW